MGLPPAVGQCLPAAVVLVQALVLVPAWVVVGPLVVLSAAMAVAAAQTAWVAMEVAVQGQGAADHQEELGMVHLFLLGIALLQAKWKSG